MRMLRFGLVDVLSFEHLTGCPQPWFWGIWSPDAILGSGWGLGEKPPHVELTSFKPTSLTPLARISHLFEAYKSCNHSCQLRRVNHLPSSTIYPIFSTPTFGLKDFSTSFTTVVFAFSKNKLRLLQVPLMKRLPRDERPIVAEACEACEFQNGDVPCLGGWQPSLRKKEPSERFFYRKKEEPSFLENGVHGYAIYIYTYCTTVHIKVELTWSMVTLQVALLARWLSNKGIQVMPSTWSALGKLGSSWTPTRAKIKHLDCRAFAWECRHFMSVWLELHYAGVLMCRFLWSPNLLFAKWPGFLGGMHRWIRLIYQKDSKTCSKTCDSRGSTRHNGAIHQRVAIEEL